MGDAQDTSFLPHLIMLNTSLVGAFTGPRGLHMYFDMADCHFNTEERSVLLKHFSKAAF